ncbi:hypothetical protein [Streptomyces orinoci]|uniref:Uncharacterized protein n=1 Tax=Streptomyces orinoci TaxID=67339 RepID=A0ABV3K596_STRON|nr:hypothetical protein [Streptomyces orinoci]
MRTRHSKLHGTAHYTCAGADPAVKWAKSVIKGAGEAGCRSLATTAVEMITWNSGEHSTVLYKPQPLVPVAGGEVLSLVEGTVIKGKYQGHTVSSPGAQLTLNALDCATEKGVEMIDGPSTLVIL